MSRCQRKVAWRRNWDRKGERESILLSHHTALHQRMDSDSPALSLPTAHLSLDHFRSLPGSRLVQAKKKKKKTCSRSKEGEGVGETEQILSCHPSPFQLPRLFSGREQQHFPVLLLLKAKRSAPVRTTSMPAPWLPSVLKFRLRYSLKINLLSISSNKVLFRLWTHIWSTYRWRFLVFSVEWKLEQWDWAQVPAFAAFLLCPLGEAGPLYFQTICLPEK